VLGFYNGSVKEALGRQISMVASLEEPARRALYFHVASRSPEPVSRDEAAAAAGISRRLAAFHLDKLVEVGLLEAIHKRLSGRTGPGAGRPAKLYRRTGVQIEISLPERRYMLLARLMAEAMKGEGTGTIALALKEGAREFGVELGKQARARAGLRRTQARLLQAAAAILEEVGFQPTRPTEGAIRLRNCPFRPLASDYPETICGMNLSLFEGMLAGLGSSRTRVHFQPDTEACCVSLQPGSL
jgi:predicted ArsR family transcriptional regulator